VSTAEEDPCSSFWESKTELKKGA